MTELDGRRADIGAERADEAGEGQRDAAYVCDDGLDVPAAGVVIVLVIPAAVVEVGDEGVAVGEQVVVRDHDGDDAGHEESISGQERREHGRRGEDLPRANGEGEKLNDELAAGDVNIAREQHAAVAAKGYHVGSDVGAEDAHHPGEGQQEDGEASGAAPVAVEDGAEQVPRVPEGEAPIVVDGRGGEDAEGGCERDADGLRDQLRPHGASSRLAPPRNVGLVRDERGGVAHAAVDGVHPEPACRATAADLAVVDAVDADAAARVGHAEDEQAPDGWDDDDALEPEELAELVGSEGAEGEVDEPEEEESKHVGAGDADGFRDVIGNIGEPVAEDAAEDVGHEACAGED